MAQRGAAFFPRRLSRPAASAGLLLALGLSGLAHALDVATNKPPMAIEDQSLSVKSRSVKLPAGAWTFVGYFKREQSINSGLGGAHSVQVHVPFAMQTNAGQFQMGVLLELGEAGLPVPSDLSVPFWGRICEPTNRQHLFFEKRSTPAAFPSCLALFKLPKLFKTATGPIYRQAGDWLAANQVNQDIEVYELQFIHSTSTGKGWISLYFPVTAFASEPAAIERLKQMPEEFMRFLATRDDQVQIRGLQ